jgi:pimeloyl-ACP methyl ester carboxylesterase
LTYDRLGVGLSDHPDPYETVQIPVQREILVGLTTMAREGTLFSNASSILSSSRCLTPVPCTLAGYKPRKVVHIGHSFGSILTATMMYTYGSSLSDGAVLTGFVQNTQLRNGKLSSFNLEYAAESDPARFAAWGSGYMTQASRSAIQLVFFKKGSFTRELLDYAFSIAQPTAIGEWYRFPSVSAALGLPATKFTGPLQFVLGEYDWSCLGDCKGTYTLPALQGIYPNASNIEVQLQPGTGHGLTFSTNATAGYALTLDFLDKNGL